MGKKIFYKNEPVCYFDTLKTSTLEGAATTVYAQGGRGNARLMSWDGERTVTFTMEDALISPIGLSILTGAGLIEADTEKKIIQHVTETIERKGGKFYVKKEPYIPESDEIDNGKPTIYGMILDENGEVSSEPYLLGYSGTQTADGYEVFFAGDFDDYSKVDAAKPAGNTWAQAQIVLVDYYTAHESGAFEVNITPDKFGGTFYLEASTLWRDQATKKDLPAEFIIPACRVQSNFTFSMSSSGDPSTFTFTMDAFPDYTRWNRTEKVLATIQVIGANLEGVEEPTRDQTWSNRTFNDDGTLNENTRALYAAPVISTFTYTPAEGNNPSKVNIVIDNILKNSAKHAVDVNGNELDQNDSNVLYDKMHIVIYNTKTGDEILNTTTIDSDGGEYFLNPPAGVYRIKVKGFKEGHVSKVGSYNGSGVAQEFTVNG